MKRNLRWIGARALAVATAAAVAFLSSAPLRAAEGESVSPFAGDVGNALWTLVIFGLVVFVLGRYAWGPMLKALQTRENFIHDSLAEAKKEHEEATARLKEYTDKLNAARAESTSIVEAARRDAEAVKRKIEDEAKLEAAKIVERAKREITLAKESAVEELYALSAKLSTDVASRILGREIRAEDHERLIREAIAAVAAHRTGH